MTMWHNVRMAAMKVRFVAVMTVRCKMPVVLINVNNLREALFVSVRLATPLQTRLTSKNARTLTNVKKKTHAVKSAPISTADLTAPANLVFFRLMNKLIKK